MTHHLCISVTFLDPFFHGKSDNDQPEWPPSPMRLFQALLAGSRAGCQARDWSSAKDNAFQWLAEQTESAPPIIAAPEAHAAPSYTLYLPNNDGDKEFDRQNRLTSKVVRPHSLDDGQSLHYIWSIDEKDWPSAQDHVKALCHEARHLLALGWGIDQVVGYGRILSDDQFASLPGKRWRPWDGYRPGGRRSRTPTKDSLMDLEKVHQSFVSRVNGKQYRPPLKPQKFNRVAYVSANTLPPRSYAAFEFSEGVAFRQEDANKVAAMVRSLACKHQEDFRQQFAEDTEVYLAGHVGPQERTPARFSYLPLPTIGHEHADGMIRRLLIAEPYGGDGRHARWVQQRLRYEPLIDSDSNERGLLLNPWRPGSQRMIDRYLQPRRVWSSVTPVILPGFDHGKQARAEQLFLRAAQQAELPVEAIAEITLRKAPYWPGSLHPRQYRVPNYLEFHPSWHVRVVFREPMGGPIAIGAGRHCGLGIFAGLDR
jgi:CRISPR-associated protein Csb2